MNDNLKTINIDLTDYQVDLLRPLFEQIKSGYSVIAQIYPDGMIATVLNEDESLNVSNAIRKTRVRRYKEEKFSSSLKDRMSLNESND